MIRRKLHNRVAIITGISGEIERRVAFQLAQMGCHLIIGSNNQEILSHLESELSNLRTGVICQKTNISDPQSIKNLYDVAMKHFARIDYLICHSGHRHSRDFSDMSIDTVKQSMHINFYSILAIMNEIIPHMLLKQNGHIIVISSLSAKKSTSYDAAYVASNAALSGYFNSIRPELRRNGISISQIYPMEFSDSASKKAKRKNLEKVSTAVVHCLKSQKSEQWVPYLSSKILLFLDFFSPKLADLFVNSAQVGKNSSK